MSKEIVYHWDNFNNVFIGHYIITIGLFVSLFFTLTSAVVDHIALNELAHVYKNVYAVISVLVALNLIFFITAKSKSTYLIFDPKLQIFSIEGETIVIQENKSISKIYFQNSTDEDFNLLTFHFNDNSKQIFWIGKEARIIGPIISQYLDLQIEYNYFDGE